MSALTFYEASLTADQTITNLADAFNTCHQQISQAYIDSIFNAPLPKYVAWANVNEKPIGFTIVIGPLTRDDIKRIKQESKQEFIDQNIHKWAFVQYGAVNKYNLVSKYLKKYNAVLYWRELTCVTLEYTNKYQPNLNIALTLRNLAEQHINNNKTWAVILAVDTSVPKLIQQLKVDGFQIVIGLTGDNDEDSDTEMFDFSVGIKVL